MLTKQNYERIADRIAVEYVEPRTTGTAARAARNDGERAAIGRIVGGLAAIFEEENPRFNVNQFIERALPKHSQSATEARDTARLDYEHV